MNRGFQFLTSTYGITLIIYDKTALAVSYIGGHPDLNKQNVIGRLVFKEDEFVFGVPTWAGFGPLKRLFGIPYEKIISVTTDIEKDWSGMRMAAGWLFLGPIGAMLSLPRATRVGSGTSDILRRAIPAYFY